MKPTLVFILGFVAALVMAAIAVAIVVYSGSYNVAAATRHTAIVHASLNKMMVNSVRAHAREVSVPPGIDLHDRALAQRAVGEFNSMCRMCHGAPGIDADRWSQALYPVPPDLIHALREHKWSDEEVFWIIKHGVKDTGMSAFGDSHSDEAIWALTALVRQSLDLSPEEYRAMTARAAGDSGGHGDSSNAHQSQSPHQH